jgi:hypothetical protein
MVTQFKDNPLERQFYPYDQKIAIANYKRAYYIPALESKLAYVVQHPSEWRNTHDDNKVKLSLDLLHSEISHELEQVGKDRLPELDKLEPGKFDSVTYEKTRKFLSALKDFYRIKLNRAQEEQEKLRASLTDGDVKLNAYNNMKMRFQNQAVMRMVENSTDPVRIVEWNGELIQKIFPIYFEDHRPKTAIDFRDNFYIPTKVFAGRIYDTLYFNVTVIWIMTALLYLTLHFELLQKAVHGVASYKKYRIWKL